MSILLTWLLKFAGAFTSSQAPQAGLIKLLQAGGAAVPELKPLADEWTAKLNAAVSLPNLVNVIAAAASEVSAIFGGKIDPREHPSDGA